MANDNIKCYGWFAEGLEDGDLPDVLILMKRSDIHNIIRMLSFGAEQSDNFGFIRESVWMVDALRRVLDEHIQRWDDDKADLE